MASREGVEMPFERNVVQGHAGMWLLANAPPPPPPVSSSTDTPLPNTNTASAIKKKRRGGAFRRPRPRLSVYFLRYFDGSSPSFMGIKISIAGGFGVVTTDINQRIEIGFVLPASWGTWGVISCRGKERTQRFEVRLLIKYS